VFEKSGEQGGSFGAVSFSEPSACGGLDSSGPDWAKAFDELEKKLVQACH